MNKHMFIIFWIILVSLTVLMAQDIIPGSPEEPVRYVGKDTLNFEKPDAGLNLVVGVQSYQIYRTFPNYPQYSDGLGWRYHHHPMMTYWNGKFYSSSTANPIDEDTEIGCVLLSKSKNGKEWSLPKIIFPSIKYKNVNTLSNHRMGFYIAPNGILLATTAYYPYKEKLNKNGARIHTTDENKEYFGIAVREIKLDDSFGEIYFIAHNDHLYTKSELPFPYYNVSTNKKFLDACNSLLNDRVVTLHWWENLSYKNFPYPKTFVDYVENGKGFGKGISYYYRKDGALVGLWKMSYSALSYDSGKTWTKPVKLSSLGTGFPKVWGEQTEDGKYAISWRPSGTYERFPMAIATSDDGIIFNNMLTVTDEVYKRYLGFAKDNGPCNYQRGFYQKIANPPGTDMWLTYSMSKEDIWISRIPVPIKSKIVGDVDDTFDNMETNGVVIDWNIYHPKYAPISIVEFPSKTNKSLELKDQDPNDYAKALRIFEETDKAKIMFKVLAKQNNFGRLEVELCDSSGQVFFNLGLDGNKNIYAHDFGYIKQIAIYKSNQWYNFNLDIDAKEGAYNLSIKELNLDIKGIKFTTRKIKNNLLKRLVFRTGPYRGININPVEPETDRPLKMPSIFYIDDVKIQKQK